MKFRNFVVLSGMVLATFASAALASPISFNATVTTANAQKGRLSRNGVPQDFAGSEPFPGVFNPATTYYYQGYTFGSGLFQNAQYIDVTINDLNPNRFVSAYASSYDPKNLSFNWLGDAGGSADFFGDPNDPRFFDFVLPANSNLILIVNNTGANGVGTGGTPANIVINSYGDSSYGDPAPTPEPSTFVMLGTGILGVAGAMKRRYLARA